MFTASLQCANCHEPFDAEWVTRRPMYCNPACADQAKRQRSAERPRVSVWSCGGGVQSTAIAVLIGSGRIAAPDYSVMIDTGREAQRSWDYVCGSLTPYLANHGITLEIIRSADWIESEGERPALWNDDAILIPAFTESGKLRAFCSGHWKRDACQNWMRSKGIKDCELWLGYSTDERRRVHTSQRYWVHNRFPLLEANLSRNDCEALIESAGLPRAPKTSCWMCPHRTATEWSEMRTEYPGDFAKAVALDEEIRAADAGLYIAKARKPLAMIEPDNEAPNLFSLCESGYCGI